MRWWRGRRRKGGPRANRMGFPRDRQFPGMNQQNKAWQQVLGGVFIVLALGWYAISFVEPVAKQPAVAKIVAGLKQYYLTPPVLQSFPKASPTLALVDKVVSPLAILLLGVGIAWNARRSMGVRVFRGLGGYFAAMTVLVLVGLLMGWRAGTVTRAGLWPMLGMAVVFLLLGSFFLWQSMQGAKATSEGKGATPAAAAVSAPISAASSATAKVTRKVNYSACNVFRRGTDVGQLWQFDVHKNEFRLNHEQSISAGGSLPMTVVTKSWSSLWQPKLNVAWLPPESVFLRVVHLPSSSLEESLSMVELQLEKLSPIPLTQLVWSVQPLPQSSGDLQTVIVILAERKTVEEFLGKIEGQGFLPDRLELPVVDQLLATAVREDGAWIYPGAWSGVNTALVAWWYGGTLQNLNFIALHADAAPSAGLNQQLSQTIWAGELEGWLTSPPAWHLVGDGAAVAQWEPVLRQELGEPIQVSEPLMPVEQAALTANRVSKPETRTNLLPPEFSKRYQQQFVDRLWIHALFAVGIVYVAAVLVYFAVVGVVSFQAGAAEKQVRSMANTYTNAMQLRAKLDVLKERQELKFAALECWKAVAELLPETATLDGFNFGDGRTLTLSGTAPKDQVQRLIDFNSDLRKATADGQPLFSMTGGKEPAFRSPSPTTVNWSFSLELKRVPPR
jgi:hypothetical protein